MVLLVMFVDSREVNKEWVVSMKGNDGGGEKGWEETTLYQRCWVNHGRQWNRESIGGGP